MYAFIDESGTFLPSEKRESAISCVGTLVIPECKYEKVQKGFIELSATWPRNPKGEIKGSGLDETHIPQLIPLLKRTDAIFQVTATDLNRQTDKEITDHKMLQSERMGANITDKHHPNVRQKVVEMRAVLEKMPNQLYMKTVAMNDVVDQTIRYATLYYCQRKPAELRRFKWVIDAQDPANISRYEEWWQNTVMPFLQSKSMREPYPFLEPVDIKNFRNNQVQNLD